MSVWAHPDDESFFAAGIMAAAVDGGQKVICVCATDGERGIAHTTYAPPEKMAKIRAQELEAAMTVLGVKECHALGYADGGCAAVPSDDVVAKLKKLIDKYRPDTILTFGPDGMTGHDDHRAVSKWVGEAAHGTDINVYHAVLTPGLYQKMLAADQRFNIFFNIDRPPVVEEAKCGLLFRLPDERARQKYRCLCAMPSQTEAMFSAFGEEAIRDMIGAEAFVKAK